MTKQSFVIGEYSVICTLCSVLFALYSLLCTLCSVLFALYSCTHELPPKFASKLLVPLRKEGQFYICTSIGNPSPKAKRHRWKTQLKLFCFTEESEDCLPCGALYFLNNAIPHKFRSAVKQKKRLSVTIAGEQCLRRREL